MDALAEPHPGGRIAFHKIPHRGATNKQHRVEFERYEEQSKETIDKDL